MAIPVIEGDVIVTDADIPAILSTIKSHESSNRNLFPNKARASGYYQYIPSTWNKYRGYEEAYLAPASVQDERAQSDIKRFLALGNYHVSAVPINWYFPLAWRDNTYLDKIPRPDLGNTLTVRQYAVKWLRTLGTFRASGPMPDAPVVGPTDAVDSVTGVRRTAESVGISGASLGYSAALAGVNAKDLQLVAGGGSDPTITTAQIDPLVISAVVEMTIEGASTITLVLNDHKAEFRNSDILASRAQLSVQDMAFELCQVSKSGDQITLTFEDVAVAALRRRRSPRKTLAGTMSRADFIASLLTTEEPWIKFVRPVEVPNPVALTELARGKLDTIDVKANFFTQAVQKANIAVAGLGLDPSQEDTWACAGRIADDVGYRRFMLRGREMWWVTDDWLLAQPIVFNLREGYDGVETIDYDYDVGKPTAEVSVVCRAESWHWSPGVTARILEQGIISKNVWILKRISRSLYDEDVTLTFYQPSALLLEPQNDTDVKAAAAVAQKQGETELIYDKAKASLADTSFTFHVPSTLVSLGQGLHQLRPDAAAAFKRAEARAGRQIKVTDSFRTNAQQADLKQRKPTLAAAPGTSGHEMGICVDIVDMQDLTIKAALEAEDWHQFDRKKEPWHWSFHVTK